MQPLLSLTLHTISPAALGNIVVLSVLPLLHMYLYGGVPPCIISIARMVVSVLYIGGVAIFTFIWHVSHISNAAIII